MILRILIWLIAFCAIPATVFAQTNPDTDSDNSIATSEPLHSPRKASIYSAVLPGLGQIYNRKIWKVPVVYAGLGGFGYMTYSNQSQFNRYKNAYINRQNGLPDEFSSSMSAQGLLNEMDRFRRYRDLSILGVIVFYTLQIIDANVDANLFDFDVSDDLSMSLQPTVIVPQNSQFLTTGITLTINLR